MKRTGEKSCPNQNWASDEDVDRISLAALTGLQIPPGPGQLESHATDLLRMLGALTADGDHGMTGYAIQNAMREQGYDKIAAPMALRKLERLGLVEWVMPENHQTGNEHQVRAITDAGLDLLEATISPDELRSGTKMMPAPAPPQPDYNYDEEPF